MPNPYRRAAFFAAAAFLLIIGFLASGCSDESSTRVVVQVLSVNQNQPLQSDVVRSNPDSSFSVREDEVLVQVQAMAADPVLDLSATGPFGSVLLERYEVTFECSETIPSVSGGLGWTVPVGETVTGSFVIVPAQLKMNPPLVGLGAGGEIVATAHITIHGKEATSNTPVTLRAFLPVHFANWSDS